MKLLDNPYTIGRPIVDPAGFVGREELLEAVRAALLVDGHKGVGIRGGRRMGRSSILHQLRARMAAVPELRPVYVDLRSRLRAPIEVMVPHLAQAVARGLHIGAPRLLGPADIAFREAWLPEKIDALDGAKLVLLLDSFEGLVEPSRAAAAASFYRYIGGLLGRVQNLRVIASFGHQVTGVGSDVVAGFQVFDVPPLELEDVQALMLRSHKQGTLRWEPRAGMAVWALTRGHPELTQLLCSEVWEELNYYDPSSVPEVTVSEVHSAANKAVESAAPIVDRLWSSFEPASRVVLAALASQPSEEVSLGELWRALGESGVHELGPRIEAVPRELEARGVLERVAGDDGDRLRIRYPLLHKALARHRPLRRVQAELDRVEPEADAYYRDALDLTKDPERRGSDAIVARLRSALELNPNHAKAMALLADILLKDGEEDEAVRLLERLYEIQPDAARPQLVEVLLISGQRELNPARRLALHERVLEYAPDNREANEVVRSSYRAQAEELLERGELRGARAAFVRAGLEERARELEQQAHDAEVAAGLAELAQMRERCEFDRAIEYARRLAERYPDAHENWTALFERIQKDGVLDGLYREGVAALEAGDSSTAQALLSQVASIDPHYRDVSRYLYVAVHGEDPAARVKPPAEEADEPVTPIAGETVEAQEVAPSEGRSGRGVALLIAAAAVAAILWAFGDRAPAPVPERSPTKQAAPVETPAPTPSPKEAPVVEPPPREPVEAPTIGPAPAPAPAAAADGVDISELLARGWAALRGLDPVEVSAVERELLTAIHDRKRGLPGAEQLAEARILRAELLLTRALTTAIVRTIDPRMIDEDDVARAEEELARASAELAEVDDEALRGSVAQRRGRVAALRALVAGEPLEVALDLLPTGSPEDIRALILHASLWRAPESLTRDELAAVVERLATLAAADDGRVIDLLHGLALYRLFRRTRLADDKRRARQVVLPLRDALPDERIGWALHRALTRRPAPRGIQGVYKVVRADIKRSCGAPKSGERVRVRLDVKPRAGAVLFTAFVTGRPDDAAFATCLKDRLSKLRYQRFTEDALDGAEMEFMASEPDAP